jgi:hypothetical protein
MTSVCNLGIEGDEQMVISKLLPHTSAETKKELTKERIRDYFLSKPDVFGLTLGELRIGENGRGKIEIQDHTHNLFRVIFYEDSSKAARESYDHINEAIYWCLGADDYSTYRRLFDPDLRVLTVVPTSVQDLDQLYSLAMVYLEILGDDRCVRLESELQDIRKKLRSEIGLHISRLL